MFSRLRFSVLLFAVVVCLLIEEARSQGRGNCQKPKVKNGRAKVRSRGAVVYFRCRRNFILIGSKYATCYQGRWSQPTPICAAKDCSPPTITKVVSMELTNSGSIATFSCAPGYIMMGPRMAVCVGRVWNGTAPQCIGSDGIYGMTCTFENKFRCGWTQDKTDDFDWDETNGATATSDTGPSFDHTLGKGKPGTYLYIEASMPRVPNDTARLLSPVFSEKYSYSCFDFWYHLYGRVGAGELRVYLKPVDKELRELEPGFEMSGNQGDVWRKGMVTIPIFEKPFQIVIEAKRLNTYFSDIAVDDLKIARCPDGIHPTLPGSTDITENIWTSSTPMITEEAHTPSATQAVQTQSVTKGAHTSSSTEVAQNPSTTEAVQTKSITEKAHTQSSTVGTDTPSATAHTKSFTEGTNTQSATVGAHTQSATEGSHTKSATVGAHTQSVTEAAHTQSVTEGAHTQSVTEGAHTQSATESAHTQLATEEAQTQSATESAHTPSATESAHTPSATEGAHTQSATVEGAHTQSATESAHTPSATKGEQTPSATEGAHTPSATEGAQTQSATESAHTTSATESAHTQSATEGAQTQSATDSAHTQSATESAHTQSATEGAHTLSATESAHTQSATESAHTQSAKEGAHTQSATQEAMTPSATKRSGTGIVVYKPSNTNKSPNALDEEAKDNNIKVDIDNKVNPFARTGEVSSGKNSLTYPVTIYVALSIFAAFAAVFIIVGLVGYTVQRRRRRSRRESQVEELKPITSGDTLLEQWLSWRIYETVE